MLLTIFLFSILLLFVDNPVAAIKKGIDELTESGRNVRIDEQQASDGNKDPVNDIIEIKENGIINVRIGKVYTDEDLKNLEKELPFATEVFVEEEINESVYKVRLGDTTEAYMALDEVNIIEGLELDVADYAIEDFLRVFPDSFRDSYSYFFAFLGVDYNHLKSSLQGLTDEGVNELGEKVIVYDYDNISYFFEGDFARAIEVRNINVELLIVSNLKLEPRIVSNDDDTMFYFLTNEYAIVIDYENRSMIFIDK